MKKSSAIILSFLLSGAAFATTYTVTITADNGAGSLRQAVSDANNNSGTDTIIFFGITYPDTITLTSGQLNNTDNLVINGPGVANLAVDGNNASRVFKNSGISLTLNNLAIQHGNATGSGEQGGGILNYGGTLIMSGCVVQNCTNDYDGGGIGSSSNGTATISNSTITGNNTTFFGGGLNNDGTLTLTNCIVSGNTSTYGGGIRTEVGGNTTLTNCTISGNTASANGGGICLSTDATATLMNVTIANNNGGGVYMDENGVWSVPVFTTTNSIFSNTTNFEYWDFYTATSNGYNLSSDGTMGSFLTNTGDMNSANPLLNALANNGGNTQTHSLQCGSSAINAGTSVGALATDQRGIARAGNTDIGAFEFTPVVVNLGPDVTLCGGSVILDAGNAGSTYAWSTTGTTQTINVSSTGNYSVTVTDGCSGTASDAVMVTINPLPTVSLGADVTACGSSTLDAGNAGSAYIWSTTGTTQTINVSSSNAYSVVVTDANNCSNSDAINLTINPVPTVSLGADVTQCGGNVTLNAGNAGSTYAWSTTGTTQTINVSSSNTYSVVVTDANNCSNSDAIVVTINPFPDLTTTLNGVVITANQNGASYQWIYCSNNLAIAGATNQSYTATVNGNYAVVVTLKGCTDTSLCANISTVGIIETSINNQLFVYPNPSNGLFTIHSANEGFYSIVNESGQIMKLFKLNAANKCTLNVENLSKGVYFIVGLDNLSKQKIVVTK